MYVRDRECELYLLIEYFSSKYDFDRIEHNASFNLISSYHICKDAIEYKSTDFREFDFLNDYLRNNKKYRRR